MNDDFLSAAKKKSQVLLILWFAMGMTIPVLGFVLSRMPGAGTPPPTNLGQAEESQFIFAAMAGMEAIVVYFLRGRITSGRGFGGGAPSAQKLVNREQASERALASMGVLFAPWVVCMALSESVGVLGFVVAHMARDPSLAIPFFALAVILLISLFPRMPTWLERRRDLIARGEL